VGRDVRALSAGKILELRDVFTLPIPTLEIRRMRNSINRPAARPASLSGVARHGGFFCRVCQAFTGPTEETTGEVYARCERCHQAGVLEWRPPTLQNDPVST